MGSKKRPHKYSTVNQVSKNIEFFLESLGDCETYDIEVFYYNEDGVRLHNAVVRNDDQIIYVIDRIYAIVPYGILTCDIYKMEDYASKREL